MKMPGHGRRHSHGTSFLIRSVRCAGICRRGGQGDLLFFVSPSGFIFSLAPCYLDVFDTCSAPGKKEHSYPRKFEQRRITFCYSNARGEIVVFFCMQASIRLSYEQHLFHSLLSRNICKCAGPAREKQQTFNEKYSSSGNYHLFKLPDVMD